MFRKSKVYILVLVSILFVMCNQKEQIKSSTESILKGTATIFVDETLTPIIEDQVAVFESNYEAKIKIVSKSEIEDETFKLNVENTLSSPLLECKYCP